MIDPATDAHTRPDPGRSALLTVDMQNDFTRAGAPAEIPGTRDVVEPVGRLAAAFRASGRPIVHVIRFYAPDGSDAERVRRSALQGGLELLAPGSQGADVVAGLLPPGAPALDAGCLRAGRMQSLGDAEWAMYKPRWNAFFGTPLAEFLRGQGVDTVVVSGCNYPGCVRATTVGATEHDFRTVLARDAVSRLDPLGIDEMVALGVVALDSATCSGWFEQGHAAA